LLTKNVVWVVLCCKFHEVRESIYAIFTIVTIAEIEMRPYEGTSSKDRRHSEKSMKLLGFITPL